MARAGTSCTEVCFREGICLFKISLRTASQVEWGETENRAERGRAWPGGRKLRTPGLLQATLFRPTSLGSLSGTNIKYIVVYFRNDPAKP